MSYAILYSTTDNAGNTGTATRVVVVEALVEAPPAPEPPLTEEPPPALDEPPAGSDTGTTTPATP